VIIGTQLKASPPFVLMDYSGSTKISVGRSREWRVRWQIGDLAVVVQRDADEGVEHQLGYVPAVGAETPTGSREKPGQ
jgi:hypothetical protein